MILREPIRTLPGQFDQALLSRIEQAASRATLQAAHAYMAGETGVHRGERDAQVCYLQLDWLTALLKPLIDTINRGMGWNFSLTCMEQLQYGVYGPSGHHGWHADQLLPGTEPTNAGLQRKLSFIISLNEGADYEGGDFELEYGHPESLERRRRVPELRQPGTLVVFPSFIYHRVLPVTRGERRTLVGFICGPPFR
ncbi:2OG-Fe(II) oxygenase [Alkalilimnicola sp. S0819]|uniref:2OG-Fe(II) oxygenase n=1 Tax=Alkalilimnicola sp. S0819 TaxID=2613922 RepID=UPI00186ABB94|nr:2OG-Fe(II) oxygenase [Alkalilimnicola sp. S0819]